MSDEDLLLRAICNDPEEDTPRLVYADWLQENGEEKRAEYIRYQVDLYRKYEKVPHKRRVQERYYHNLVWGLDPTWRGFERPKGSTIKDEYWERGFLWEVRWDWDYFWSDQDRLRTLFSRHPIRRVWITDKEPNTVRHSFFCCYWQPHTVIGLPHDMLRWFPTGQQTRYSDGTWISFRDDRLGVYALSIATVRYGRALVGLRDLTEEERFPKGRKR